MSDEKPLWRKWLDALTEMPAEPAPAPRRGGGQPRKIKITGPQPVVDAIGPHPNPSAVCHGCHWFKGDDPRLRKLRPKGHCALPSPLNLDRDRVSWKTKACAGFVGWAQWCTKCGAGLRPGELAEFDPCSCGKRWDWK